MATFKVPTTECANDELGENVNDGQDSEDDSKNDNKVKDDRFLRPSTGRCNCISLTNLQRTKLHLTDYGDSLVSIETEDLMKFNFNSKELQSPK